MLSSAASRVYRYLLKRLLGSLLSEDLRLDQLDVRLREQALELRDLRLRGEALEAWLGLDGVRVRAAGLGRVRLRVPGPGEGSDSCLLEVEDVVLSCVVKEEGEEELENDTHPSARAQARAEAPPPPPAATSDSEVREGLDFLARWIERVTARVRVEVRGVVVTLTSPRTLHTLRLELDRVSYYAPGLDLAQREIRLGGKLALSLAPLAGRCSVPLLTLANTADTLCHLVLAGSGEGGEFDPIAVDVSATWVAMELDPDCVQALLRFFPPPSQAASHHHHHHHHAVRWNPEQSLIVGEVPLEASLEPRDVEVFKTLAPSVFRADDDDDGDASSLTSGSHERQGVGEEEYDDDDDEFLDAYGGSEMEEDDHVPPPQAAAPHATMGGARTPREVKLRVQRAQLVMHGRRMDQCDILDVAWLDGLPSTASPDSPSSSRSSSSSASLHHHNAPTTHNRLVLRAVGVMVEVTKMRRRVMSTVSLREFHATEKISSVEDLPIRTSPVLSFSSSSSTSPVPDVLLTYDSDSARVHITLAPCTLTCDMGLVTRYAPYVVVAGGDSASSASTSTTTTPLTLSCTKLAMHLIPMSNVNAFRSTHHLLGGVVGGEDDSLLVTLDDFFAASDRATASGGVVHLLNAASSKLHVLSLMKRADVPLSLKLKLASDVLSRRGAGMMGSPRLSSNGSVPQQRPAHLTFETSEDNSSDEDEAAYDAVTARFCARAVAEAGVTIEVFIPRVEAHDLWGETYQRAIAAGQAFVRKEMVVVPPGGGASGSTTNGPAAAAATTNQAPASLSAAALPMAAASPPSLTDVDSETPFLVLACDAGAVTFRDERGGPDLLVTFVGASLSCAEGTDIVVRIADVSLDELHENRTLKVPILHSTKHWGGARDTAMVLMLVQSAASSNEDGGGEDNLSLGPRQASWGGADATNTYESSVSACLRGATIRFEPGSAWFERSNRLMVPDGRSFPTMPVWFTNLRFAAYDLLVDYSPAYTPKPYASVGEAPPDHRALVAFGRFRARANVISVATIQTYKISARDVELFLASPAPPRDDAFESRAVDRARAAKPAFANLIEFAEEARFVRVGHLGQLRADVRVSAAATSSWDLELFAPDLALFTCTDSLMALVDLSEALARTSSPRGGADSSSKDEEDDERGFHSVWVEPAPPTPPPPAPAPTPAAPPKPRGVSPPAATSSKRPQAARHHPPVSVTAVTAVKDHELSARDLRERYATVPDDQLTAAQLRVRYQKEVHLAPFVIDDYYSIGSLPSAAGSGGGGGAAAGAAAAQSGGGTGEGTWHSAPTPPRKLDEWSFVESLAVEEDDDDAEVDEDVAPPLAPPPPTSAQALQDAAALMSRSFFLGAPAMSTSAAGAAGDDDEGGGEEIQLLTAQELEAQSGQGNKLAMDLRESYHHLAEDAHRADVEAEDEARYEANQYSSALAESRASVEFQREVSGGSSTAAASRLWHPGTSLVVEEEEEGEEEGEEPPPLVVPPPATTTTTMTRPERETDQTGWFEPANEVRVFAHHLGVPFPPGPGSHVPPATALAAAKLLGRESATTSSTRKGRVVFREVGVSWRFFAGLDFSLAPGARAAARPPTAAAARRPEGTEEGEDAFRTARRSGGGVLGQAVMENHMDPLFPRDKSEKPPPFGSRDLDRAVELVAKSVTAFIESVQHGSADEMFAAFSVGDVEVFDHVKTSSVRRMVSAWVNETLHPRETDAAMLRVAVELSPRENHVCVATLPLSVSANQDTLALLSRLADQLVAAGGRGRPGRGPPAPFTPLTLDVRACKLKIDYIPIRVDLDKVREGNYAEMLNLFTYQGIEVALRRVRAAGGTWEAVQSQLVQSWSVDVTNKALYKVLAGVTSPPLATAAALGSGLVNLVLLPVERYRAGEGMRGAAQSARENASCFAKTVVVEALGAGANLSSLALNLVEDRKRHEPHNAREGLAVAGEALSRGLKQAHHTIVAVPLTEWKREGSVVKAVIRAIPVAVLQPLIGVTEAAEATFKGVRNQIDVDRAVDERGKWKRN